MLRLFYHPVSTFSRRVLIALLEKRIEHQAVVVDLFARAQRSADYLALNPYGRVPTIDDDGFILYESAAILMYLEATRPTPPLVPQDPKGRARIDMQMRLCDVQLAPHASKVLFAKRFLPEDRWDRSEIAQAKAEIEKHFLVLERALSESPYLGSDAFSLADLMYLPILHFLPLMDIEPGPHLAAWRTRILSRPSVQATVPSQ